MKKLIVLFSAVAALAACSKNEVVPAVSGENVEISYKVAPRTKADPQTFDTHNVFASWAYYLPSDKSWSANQAEAKIYIGKDGEEGATISYGNSVWKDQTTSYYWPKEGKLTFFAYSLNSKSLTDPSGTDTHFTCLNHDSQYGIFGSLNLDTHPNTDFLVADIASDKTANENVYDFNGVPTLFKHKLSRVKFAVKKKSDYPGATITLNSITFKKVVYGMTYTQYLNDAAKGIITDYINPGTERTKEQEYTKKDFEVSSSKAFVPVPDANEVRYIYIPQDFKNVKDATKIATIEVKYTVTLKKGTSETDKGISETYTKTLNVKDIFDSWEIGKRYTFNLIFSLDEINWAPAVGDWEDEIKNIDVVTGEVKPADSTITADGDTTTDEQF